MKFHNKSKTIAEYLAALPPDRRKALQDVRKVIRRNLPKGYEEQLNWGAITYAIPLERFPDTYNKQPLCYAALAAQKNHCALYLMSAYGDTAQAARLKQAFTDAGKKLDMGKACVRFRSPDDLPLDAIGALIASTPPDRYIEVYVKSRHPAAKTRPQNRPQKRKRTA